MIEQENCIFRQITLCLRGHYIASIFCLGHRNIQHSIFAYTRTHLVGLILTHHLYRGNLFSILRIPCFFKYLIPLILFIPSINMFLNISRKDQLAMSSINITIKDLSLNMVYIMWALRSLSSIDFKQILLNDNDYLRCYIRYIHYIIMYTTF